MAHPIEPVELRQTGRTTKMLREAAAALAEGAHVVVVLAEHRQARYCSDILRDVLGADTSSKKLRLVSVGELSADRFRGLDNLRVFVDHCVYSVAGRSDLAKLAGLHHIANASQRRGA